MAQTTFAMVQTAPRKLEPRTLPLPEIGHDDALLRVEACGICGSDHEQFSGVLPITLPVIPGHEPVGIIEKIGDGAAERWGVDAGDRVAVEAMLPCHSCPRCLGGAYQLCRNAGGFRVYSYIPLSVPPGLWGGYAEHLYLHKDAIVHKIDKSVPPEIAVLFNPLGAGFRWAVDIPKTKPGDTVLILGPGQRGLASVIACRQAGAGTIIVTGLSADAHKLSLAREFGADHTLDAEREDIRDRVQEITDGRGADVVVEVTSYATEPVVAAIDYVTMGGTIVLAGVKGFKPLADFVSDKIVIKEITIRGVFGVTFEAYEQAIRLIESGRVPIRKMHTHEFSLQEAERAIMTLAGEIAGEEAVHCALLPGKE